MKSKFKKLIQPIVEYWDSLSPNKQNGLETMGKAMLSLIIIISVVAIINAIIN
jgi:hypothetical protein